MKVFALAARGGTGRLIVRFRPGERPFRRGPGSLEGERRSAGSRGSGPPLITPVLAKLRNEITDRQSSYFLHSRKTFWNESPPDQEFTQPQFRPQCFPSHSSH